MTSSAANTLQWWLQDTELAVLRNRLQSLTESHSAVLASSEQLASTHRKAEAQVAEQLQMRQQELSRTRAQVSAVGMIIMSLISPLLPQVSSLSTELAGEKKMAEELRSQLTLARAEAARHQAQVILPTPASLMGLSGLLTLGVQCTEIFSTWQHGCPGIGHWSPHLSLSFLCHSLIH